MFLHYFPTHLWLFMETLILQVNKRVFKIRFGLVLTLAFMKRLIGGAHQHQDEEEKQRPEHFYDKPHLHKAWNGLIFKSCSWTCHDSKQISQQVWSGWIDYQLESKQKLLFLLLICSWWLSTKYTRGCVYPRVVCVFTEYLHMSYTIWFSL